MTAEEILDRFTDEEVSELERYYLGTISGHGVRHEPLVIAKLLLRLSMDERNSLARWAYEHFANLNSPIRAAA